jgi:pimeloyl-ACP methyl ester carboxylesterase
MARRLPRSELEVMPDSGHMMILEHYPQVNHQLRILVGRVRAELAAEVAAGADPVASPSAPSGSRR